MRIRKKLTAVIAAAALAITSFAVMGASQNTAQAAMNKTEFAANYSYPTTMRGLTAFQLVSDMGAGWNLGNSLDSANSETAWGNPKTTKAMIDDIAKAGFTTLRVPVRWDDHYTDGKYTIDPAYLDRVETVVNYGLANGMYVILNVHHNDLQTKVTTNTSTQNQVKNELKTIWTQIGNRFKGYGDKLIFEVNNEPRSGEDWNGSAALYSVVNSYNETARAAIRATGGNNAKRLVMLPTYCASGDAIKCTGFVKPSNDNMVAVSIHAYLPFDFAFSAGHSDWRASDEAELDSFFARMKENFIDKGIPVVIGEFGTTNNNNTAERVKCTNYFIKKARSFAEQNIPCVVWDNNGFNKGQENFGLYNRRTRSFVYKDIVDAIVNGYSNTISYETKSTADGTVYFTGSAKASNWAQCADFDASVATALKNGESLYCSYTDSGSKGPELILQDSSYKKWIKINPDTMSGGIATWKYETMLKAYGGSFADLAKVYIGAKDTTITLKKLYKPGKTAAHTHNYNGATKITLQATATTLGRMTIACSYSGCTQTRVAEYAASAAKGKTLTKINGEWYYTNDGVIDSTATTLVKYGSVWYYVKNGKVDFNATTLCKYGNVWYYVKKGKVDFTATTLCKYGGTWYYVEKGKVNFKANTLVKYGSTWYYVTNGRLDTSITTLCKYGGTWYYVKNGKVDFTATTLCKYNSQWFYVKDGKVVFGTKTLCKYGSVWYYIDNGRVDFSATTLCKYGNTWYYVQKGKVNFNYTGNVKYGGSTWYVQKGVMKYKVK